MRTRSRRSRLTFATILWGAGCALPLAAFDLTGDRSLNGGADLTGESAPGIPEIISRQAGVYNWADKDGVGTPASPNLNLSAHQILTSDGTSFTLNLNGGNVSGDSGVTGLRTYASSGSAGSITLANLNAVAMGRVDTRSGTIIANSGHVTIGAPENRAGNVRVDSMDASHPYKDNNERFPGNITIYGNGDVLIRTDAGLGGDVNAHNYTHNSGSVLISHNGALAVRDIFTWTKSTWTGHSAGNITLRGDATGGMRGPASIRNVRAVVDKVAATYANDGGAVVISGYARVRISGDVETWTGRTDSTKTGGDVAITNITGDIQVDGIIDLSSGCGADYHGRLVLRNTAGTNIVAALDLTKVRHAVFDSGRRISAILGVLTGFSTNSLSGGGTFGDPYMTTQTLLRTPADQRIYYAYVPGELNDVLGGHTYRVADPDGAAGQGGRLMVEPVRGLVVIFY